MKKFIIIFFLGLLNFFSFSIAKTVTLDQAEKLAINWLNSHTARSVQYKINQTLVVKENRDTLIFVFNTSPAGYVIISGDDVAVPVIGYSLRGTFTNQNLPPALKDWLEMRKKEILQAKRDQILPEEKILNLWNSYLYGSNKKYQVREVGPLLQTTWNQDCYYNESCPEDMEGPCGHTYTGCIATAMAQVMKYWEYPNNGLGEHEYLHDEYGWIYANFLETVYEWDQMPNNVATTNDPTATIMFHCGVSVEMDYGPTYSSACNGKPPIAFPKYFGYSDSLDHIYKDNYADSVWEAKLRTDLDRGYPVYYTGGSHAFVCDGYQEDNYFHFNWGWSGAYDGYYYLNDLTPGDYDFTDNQSAIFNLKPKYKPTAEFCSDTTKGYAPLTISFYDRSLSYYQTITSWEWDFGDGYTSTEQNPIHTYQSSGTYSVKLKITTVKGDTASIIKEKYININPDDHIGYIWYVSADNGSDSNGNGNEDNPLASVQYAVNIAEVGDTILIEEGTYYETIDLKGKNLVITSRFLENKDHSTIENTIIDGQGENTVFKYTNHEDSTSKLIGLTIKNGEDGGIYCYYTSPIFQNLIITENHTTDNGGGVRCDFSNTVIKNCEITNNQADMDGGGLEIFQCDSLKIINTKIKSNTADYYGAGIQEQWSRMYLISSTISNNDAHSSGGAIDLYGGKVSIINSTLTKNFSNGVGGILHERGAYSVIENSIIWDNEHYQIEFTDDEADTTVISNSDIQGGQQEGLYSPFDNDVVMWDVGNINEDPKFITLGQYPLQLGENSPCIDTGNPDTTGLNLPKFDQAGNERIYNNRIDMGAFEYDGSSIVLKTIYVDLEGSDESGDGSEENPYRTIQKGIDKANSGDTVIVKPGLYVENINFYGKNIKVGSLFQTTNDTSYINSTIIDGDSVTTVVTFNQGEDTLCVLKGFTIQNGYADDGGGIYIDNASPKLQNLKIFKNSAEKNGGGIYICNGKPILKKLLITENDADVHGGGIELMSSSSPTLINIKIENNTCSSDGGGIHCQNNDLSFVNMLFKNNSASHGGGIAFYNSDSKLINCTLSSNSGDGVYLDRNSHLIIQNCILFNPGREVEFCGYNDPDTVEIKYSDLEDINGSWGIVTNNNGVVIKGDGNIDADPQFVDSGSEPCQLSSSSPCRNAGDPDTTDLGLPGYDLAGNPRISENHIDMGCYEYQGPSSIADNEQIPKVFFLKQNYPNPFNPITTIEYGLPKASDVKIEIFNILGQRVFSYKKEKKEAGYHKILINGSNFSSGVYFYRFVADDYVKVKKMILLK